MNAPFRSSPPVPTPHKFTLEEARKAWDAGVFDGYPDMELIDGVLVEMPADGPMTMIGTQSLPSGSTGSGQIT